MINTVIAFTFLLVTVNLLLLVVLVRISGTMLRAAHSVDVFMSGIKSVQVGLVEGTIDEEPETIDLRLN